MVGVFLEAISFLDDEGSNLAIVRVIYRMEGEIGAAAHITNERLRRSLKHSCIQHGTTFGSGNSGTHCHTLC